MLEKLIKEDLDLTLLRIPREESEFLRRITPVFRNGIIIPDAPWPECFGSKVSAEKSLDTLSLKKILPTLTFCELMEETTKALLEDLGTAVDQETARMICWLYQHHVTPERRGTRAISVWLEESTGLPGDNPFSRYFYFYSSRNEEKSADIMRVLRTARSLGRPIIESTYIALNDFLMVPEEQIGIRCWSNTRVYAEWTEEDNIRLRATFAHTLRLKADEIMLFRTDL